MQVAPESAEMRRRGRVKSHGDSQQRYQLTVLAGQFFQARLWDFGVDGVRGIRCNFKNAWLAGLCSGV